MRTLTKEELVILDYFNIAYEQIEKWVHSFKQTEDSRFQLVNMVIRCIIALCKICCVDNKRNLFDATNIFFMVNGQVTNNGEFKNFIDEMNFLEQLNIDYAKKGYESGCLEERKKWLELYKIINRVYFEFYPSEKQ